MSSILIIDDEEPIRDILSSILEDEGYKTFTAVSGEVGLKILQKEDISLVFLDLWLPKISGLEILQQLKREPKRPEIIIISGHANVDIAVQTIKDGAFDCIEKPLDLTRILNLSDKAIKSYNKKNQNTAIKNKCISNSTLIGESEDIVKIKELIQHISDSDSRVMILGENGTRKEVIAREIHLNSTRKNGPFIEVNCAALPDNLIESELFGHIKGAFTGAVEHRIGKFEAANKGTLFLDEIADMSVTAQAKVLRAIQEQKFHKVGSDDLIDVDIRIISATNKNIKDEISKGKFREDLYFRLSVIPIEIPTLKDRAGDISILANHFLHLFNIENNCNKEIKLKSYEALKKHSWPGNVRELKNFIEKITIISNSNVIDLNDFINDSIENDENSQIIEEFIDLPLSKAKDEFEKKIICSRLKESKGNIAKAAQALGIYPSNLHNKIKKHGIAIKNERFN